MAHYCECRRRIVVKSRARHTRAGSIYRRRHDLCRKCWRSLIEGQAMRNMERVRGRLSVLHGFKPQTRIRVVGLAIAVQAYKSGNRDACSN
jgi:hypothetical protein